VLRVHQHPVLIHRRSMLALGCLKVLLRAVQCSRAHLERLLRLSHQKPRCRQWVWDVA
jgi:hypothetical protein